MITVIAHRETGWFGWELGLNTEFSFWEQVCISYSVDRMIFIPVTTDANNIEHYDTMDKALANVTGTKVFLESANRATDLGREPIYLKDFKHPEDAVYILGSSLSHNLQWVEDKDALLSVEESDPIGSMFGMTMLAIVLHDRLVKQG